MLNPPILSDAKRWEKRALSVMTGLSAPFLYQPAEKYNQES
jgi:hypothetical protein